MKIAIFGRKIDVSFRDGVVIFFKNIEKFAPDNILIHANLINTLAELNIPLQFSYTLFDTPEEITSDIELFFSLGGDGTILEAIRYIQNKNIPLAGINTGRLGFLANIAQNEISESLFELFHANFQTDKRALLAFSCDNNPFLPFPYALNEITVQKHNTSLITISAMVNNEELNRYWADGLIISTPTGSTAYSMSSGGPIVSPDTSVMIITPIASHNLTVRPLIIPDHNKITLQTHSRSGKYLITIDSQSKIFESETSIEIGLAPFNILLVRLPNHSFFQTIRKKLMWGADIRN
jgi:NAD+ kinase